MNDLLLLLLVVVAGVTSNVIAYQVGYAAAKKEPMSYGDRLFYEELDRARAMLLSALPEWASDRTTEALAWMVVERLKKEEPKK